MSAMRKDGQRVELPRDAHGLLATLRENYARSDPVRMRRLQLLQLVGEGWTVGEIAAAWRIKHHGSLSRDLAAARAELVELFVEPEGGGDGDR